MMKAAGFFILFILFTQAGLAQIPFEDDRELNTAFVKSRGILFATEDSLYSLLLRFRMQNRFAYTTRGIDDFRQSSSEMLIRRLRLRLNGNLGTRRLTYAIQLGFTVEDMDGDLNQFSNIIRDAFAEYRLNHNLSVGFGQTKLPGNRERVNSSSDLQLVDRSLMNRTFNIDRDFGLFWRYRKLLGIHRINLTAVVSSGEGRNIRVQNEGYCFTGRAEWLPFGDFTSGGDYFQGDILREQKPKLSMGLSGSLNRNASRTGGQIGTVLPRSGDIHTVFADLIFKYQGWAFALEAGRRTRGENAVFIPVGLIYTGYGYAAQASYCTQKNWEWVSRVSQIVPEGSMRQVNNSRREIALGLNRYLQYHRVKIQGDLSHIYDFAGAGVSDWERWGIRFQIEVGI
jgi:phosphate-selective porin OprO/OprP